MPGSRSPEQWLDSIEQSELIAREITRVASRI